MRKLRHSQTVICPGSSSLVSAYSCLSWKFFLPWCFYKLLQCLSIVSVTQQNIHCTTLHLFSHQLVVFFRRCDFGSPVSEPVWELVGSLVRWSPQEVCWSSEIPTRLVCLWTLYSLLEERASCQNPTPVHPGLSLPGGKAHTQETIV